MTREKSGDNQRLICQQSGFHCIHSLGSFEEAEFNFE
jgi:hypothetical protein